MKLLLLAATEAEIGLLSAHLNDLYTAIAPNKYQKGALELHICISGVGIMATTYTLTKALQADKYDFALQIGVGGSFDAALPLGTTYFIHTDQYGDLGAEDHYNYLDVFELGLLDADAFPFKNKQLQTPAHPVHEKMALPHASGLTVNTVSGSDFTIKRRQEKYNCQIESMEGAPFHYVCLMEQVPFAQVRSLSNYVTPRDKGSWKMKDAIIALNNWVIDFIGNL